MPDTAVDRTAAVGPAATGTVTVTEETAGAEAATVEEVVGRLREIGARLPPADGVAVFNRLYLDVTEAVRDRLAGRYFADPAAMAELDVVFAGRYLRAVAADAAGQEPPACWRALFELRARPGVHPLQFALAGMNAHIQHDLPLAVVDTCRRRGCGPDAVEGDYHRINGVLAEVEAAVRERLMPGPDLLEYAEPLTHLLGTWSVDTAREGAWSAVEALWELRHLPGAARAFATALDGSVGLLGRALLLPLGLGGRDTPGAAPAGRLPEARNRPAGESAGAGGDAAGGDGPGRDGPGGDAADAPGADTAETRTETRTETRAAATAAVDQTQLECSGLPSA